MSELMGMKSVNSALRDQFAMEAMKLALAHNLSKAIESTWAGMAIASYGLADAMMAAREEKREA